MTLVNTHVLDQPYVPVWTGRRTEFFGTIPPTPAAVGSNADVAADMALDAHVEMLDADARSGEPQPSSKKRKYERKQDSCRYTLRQRVACGVTGLVWKHQGQLKKLPTSKGKWSIPSLLGALWPKHVPMPAGSHKWCTKWGERLEQTGGVEEEEKGTPEQKMKDKEVKGWAKEIKKGQVVQVRHSKGHRQLQEKRIFYHTIHEAVMSVPGLKKALEDAGQMRRIC